MIKKRALSKKANGGYTLMELMLVMCIMVIVSSMVMPRYDMVVKRAYQSKAKNNLGMLRTSINLYYADHDGRFPFSGYPQGISHYTNDGLSLTSVLVPKYMSEISVPKLLDPMGSYNELEGSFDEMAKTMMAMTPPKDIFIIVGDADYTPFLSSPYAYDNVTGLIYFPNGNYDTIGEYFYRW